MEQQELALQRSVVEGVDAMGPQTQMGSELRIAGKDGRLPARERLLESLAQSLVGGHQRFYIAHPLAVGGVGDHQAARAGGHGR